MAVSIAPTMATWAKALPTVMPLAACRRSDRPVPGSLGPASFRAAPARKSWR